MAYHITRSGKLDGRIMYYHGGNRWSDESVGRVNYSTKAEADAMLVNTDGKNGGFDGAAVVKS